MTNPTNIKMDIELYMHGLVFLSVADLDDDDEVCDVQDRVVEEVMEATPFTTSFNMREGRGLYSLRDEVWQACQDGSTLPGMLFMGIDLDGETGHKLPCHEFQGLSFSAPLEVFKVVLAGNLGVPVESSNRIHAVTAEEALELILEVNGVSVPTWDRLSFYMDVDKERLMSIYDDSIEYGGNTYVYQD